MTSMLPALRGRLEEHVVASGALLGNPLGDSHERALWVYLPPAYDASAEQRFPVIYVIQGYTGQVQMWANRTPWRTSYIEDVDRLFASEGQPPCIIVFVDAWTLYGGSQYVDSAGTGRYHTYLCEDVVGYVDANFRTLPATDSRAITGKSSGGFGAMITPMLRPDLFSHLATHAGDTLYEACYLPEFAQAARALRPYNYDVWAWWEKFQTRNGIWGPGDPAIITALGCSAAFSAADDGTPMLPFNPRTGQIIDDIWQRWLDWDPVRMLDRYKDALHSVQSFWIDCGTSDEYYLDLGATAFREGLARIGIPGERIEFELVEGRHGDMHPRYPLALAWLSQRLTR